jgi:hypothetical protein
MLLAALPILTTANAGRCAALTDATDKNEADRARMVKARQRRG